MPPDQCFVLDPNILVSALLFEQGKLELAVSGGARYIVTGDPDLLVLNPFRDIAIGTADQFLALSSS